MQHLSADTGPTPTDLAPGAIQEYGAYDMVESERLARLESSHDDLKNDVREMSAKVDRIAAVDQNMQIIQAEMAGNIKLLVTQTAGLPERVAKLELARATSDAYRETGINAGKAVGHVVSASAGGVTAWLLSHFWKP